MRTDLPLSYVEALKNNWTETLEVTVRKRRLLYAGFVIR